MNKAVDDLEAVRTITATLQPFESADRERIIRWVREKLGMSDSLPRDARDALTKPLVEPDLLQEKGGVPKDSVVSSDIRSFIETKNPQNDRHLAAVVAYYYQFQASEGERRNSISAEDVLEACRKANRERPKRAIKVLVDAYKAGLFDRAERGRYRLNAVGENLVAMVLGKGTVGTAVKSSRSKSTGKKPSRKNREEGKGRKKTGGCR